MISVFAVQERNLKIATKAKNIMADSTSFGFERILQQFQALKPKLPFILANACQNFFKRSFTNQGFTNKSFVPWENVDRRKNPKGKSKALATNPILHGSGILDHSIQIIHATWNSTGMEIEIGTVGNANQYAAVHNEGLKSGRGAGFTMPKREFIGNSVFLFAELEKKIDTAINSIWD